MGKRRVRNLRALGVADIAGFDSRADRRIEAHNKYGIRVVADFEHAVGELRPDALVISTPPDLHLHYAWAGFELGLHCFIEASVVDADGILALHEASANSATLIVPSCTMRFMPGPRRIKEILDQRSIGKPLLLTYQTGQYLPDWHPWEPINDFYVSVRETGGCREIVPFELTWLNDLFGDPVPVACERAKLSDVDADIDDVYSCILRYPGELLAVITVEVISRPHATRELRLLGSEGQIVFAADENRVRVSTVNEPKWKHYDLEIGQREPGYTSPEEPYVAEMRAFVDAIASGDRSKFPNTLLDDWRVLKALEQLETLSARRG